MDLRARLERDLGAPLAGAVWARLGAEGYLADAEIAGDAGYRALRKAARAYAGLHVAVLRPAAVLAAFETIATPLGLGGLLRAADVASVLAAAELDGLTATPARSAGVLAELERLARSRIPRYRVERMSTGDLALIASTTGTGRVDRPTVLRDFLDQAGHERDAAMLADGRPGSVGLRARRWGIGRAAFYRRLEIGETETPDREAASA